MKNTFFFFCLIIFICSFGQNKAQQTPENQLSFLQLSDKDLPMGYQFTDRLKCQSAQVTALYKSIANYETELGKLVHTNFQTIKGKGETATILYFQFEQPKDFKAFLESYLWGNEGKPTAVHPEEYAIYGKFLVIWSTKLDSPIKKASQDLIEGMK